MKCLQSEAGFEQHADLPQSACLSAGCSLHPAGSSITTTLWKPRQLRGLVTAVVNEALPGVAGATIGGILGRAGLAVAV